MRLTALQCDIAWEQPQQNFERLRPRIDRAAQDGSELIVLPEMFSYGFSMNTREIAEQPGGASERFLISCAAETGAYVAGSIPIRLNAGDPRPSNVLAVASPQGEVTRYAKLHPFSYAEEHRHYAAGDQPVSLTIAGVRCALFVCYDLRFADAFWDLAPSTDLYLVVANWPARRREHWITLLAARAIENQAYVCGVNRVGTGGGLDYSGDTRVLGPAGELLAVAEAGECAVSAMIDPTVVERWRREFPTLQDRRSQE
jgi:predicted amidohydrolase